MNARKLGHSHGRRTRLSRTRRESRAMFDPRFLRPLARAEGQPDPVLIRGQQLNASLPSELVERNRGRFVALDLASGQPFFGATATEALLQAEEAMPEARFFVTRVGDSYGFRLRSR